MKIHRSLHVFGIIGFFAIYFSRLAEGQVTALHAGAVNEGPIGVTGTAFTIPSSSGRTVGGNTLIHSFNQFTLPTAAYSATFSFDTLPGNAAATSITNIIARVGGGTSTTIAGSINTTAFQNASFFFLNPNGVLFTSTASINVARSSVFSSADYVVLSDGSTFYANPAANTDVNNGGAAVSVTSFGFLTATPAAISVTGSTISSTGSLQFVGGDFTATGASLSSPATLSIFSGKAIQTVPYLGTTGTYSGITSAGGQVKLDASTVSSSGHLVIRGGKLIVEQTGGAGAGSSITSTGGAQIDIQADTSLAMTGGSSIGSDTGTVNIDSGTATAAAPVTLTNSSVSSGGPINFGSVQPIGDLTVDSGASIQETAANDISILSTGAVLLEDTGKTGTGGTITSMGGDIYLGSATAPVTSLTIDSNSSIAQAGTAGDIDIFSTNAVLLENTNSTTVGGAITSAGGDIDLGSATLSVGSLTLDSRASIQETGTGNINVASGAVVLENTVAGSTAGGGITSSSTGNISLGSTTAGTKVASVAVNNKSTISGSGGEIDINTLAAGTVTIGGKITTTTGNININSAASVSLTGGTTAALSGTITSTGGDIDLGTTTAGTTVAIGTLTLDSNSSIQETTGAGNINADTTGAVTLENLVGASVVGGDITSSGTGGISLGSTTTATKIGSLAVNNKSTISGNGGEIDINTLAAGTVTIGGKITTTTGNIDINSAASVSLTGGTTAALSGTITSTGGDIDLGTTTAGTTVAIGTLTLDSNSSIQQTTGAGNINADTTGAVTLENLVGASVVGGDITSSGTGGISLGSTTTATKIGSLAVNNKSTISGSGGEIDINTLAAGTVTIGGKITTTTGNIDINSAASVSLTGGTTAALSGAITSTGGDIDLGTTTAGTTVAIGTLTLDSNSSIQQTTGAGNINADTTGAVTLENTVGGSTVGGSISSIASGAINLGSNSAGTTIGSLVVNKGTISSQSTAAGASGTISVLANGSLALSNGGQIFSFTNNPNGAAAISASGGGVSVTGSGTATAFTGPVTATNNILAFNAVTPTGIFSATSAAATGGVGAVAVTSTGANSLALSAGGQIGSLNAGSANAPGEVTVTSADTLALTTAGQIVGATTGTGAGAALDVTANGTGATALTLNGANSDILAQASGMGTAGLVGVTTTAGTLALTNNSAISSIDAGTAVVTSGTITVSASGPLTLASGSQIFSYTSGKNSAAAISASGTGLTITGPGTATALNAAATVANGVLKFGATAPTGIFSATTAGASGNVGAMTLATNGTSTLALSAGGQIGSLNAGTGSSPGTATITTGGPLNLTSDAQIDTVTTGLKPGATVSITTNDTGTTPFMIDGAGSGIFSATTSTGTGGSITLASAGSSTSSVSMLSGGAVIESTSTNNGVAGDITVQTTGNLTVAAGSSIESIMTQSMGDTTTTGYTGAVTVLVQGQLSLAGVNAIFAQATPTEATLTSGSVVTSVPYDPVGQVTVRAGSASDLLSEGGLAIGLDSTHVNYLGQEVGNRYIYMTNVTTRNNPNGDATGATIVTIFSGFGGGTPTPEGLVLDGTLGGSAGEEIFPDMNAQGYIYTTANGYTYTITAADGVPVGGNLFLSFSALNFGQSGTVKETLNFDDPNATNILARVTGGMATISGKLTEASGTTANLFILDSQGIVFGAGSQLALHGALTISTSNFVQFGTGGSAVDFYSATTPGDSTTPNSLGDAAINSLDSSYGGDVMGFGFTTAGGPITFSNVGQLKNVPGSISDITNSVGLDALTDGINPYFGELQIIGGDISLVGSEISVNQSQILLFSSGSSGTLTFKSPQNVPVASLSGFDGTGTLPANYTEDQALVENGFDLYGAINLTDITTNSSNATTYTGKSALYVGSDDPDPTNPEGILPSTIVIRGDSLNLTDSFILSQTTAVAQTSLVGNIVIKLNGTASITSSTATSSSYISTSTFGAANGGAIYFTAANLTINGDDVLSPYQTGILSNAEPVDTFSPAANDNAPYNYPTGTPTTGSGGNITLNLTGGLTQTGSLTLEDAAQISSNANASGGAGTIRVTAGALTINGAGLSTFTGISSTSGSLNGTSNSTITGPGGNVYVTVDGSRAPANTAGAGDITIIDGGQITASSYTAGFSGLVSVTQSNSVDGQVLTINGDLNAAQMEATGILAANFGSGGVNSDPATLTDALFNTAPAGATPTYVSNPSAVSVNVAVNGTSAGSPITGSVEIENGGEISSANYNSPTSGGALDLYINGSLTIAGNDNSMLKQVFSPSGDLLTTGVLSSTYAAGNAGDLNVNVAGSVTITAGSAITDGTQFASGAGGNLIATIGGDLTIDSMGSKTFINDENGNFDFVPTGITTSAFNSLQVPAADVTSSTYAEAGSLTVAVTGSTTIQHGGQISSGSLNGGNGGTLMVSTDGLTIDGSSTPYDSDVTTLYYPTGIISASFEGGNGGAVTVYSTGPVSLLNGGQIASYAFFTFAFPEFSDSNGTNILGGIGGNISLTINDPSLATSPMPALEINGSGVDLDGGTTGNAEFVTGLLTTTFNGTYLPNASTATLPTKAAGDVTVHVLDGSVDLTAGGQLAAQTDGTGGGGNVMLNIDNGSLTINGANTPGTGFVDLFYAYGSPDYFLGNQPVSLQTGVFTTSGTYGSGNAGNTMATVSGGVTISGGGVISSATNGSGSGGTVTLSAGSLTVTDPNSQISSGALSDLGLGSDGSGGTITLTVGGLALIEAGGSVTSETDGTGTAGNLTVTAGSLTVTGPGSQLTSATNDDSGAGGTVTVTLTSAAMIADGGQVTAGTFATGPAGSVIFTAGSLTVTGYDDGAGQINGASQISSGTYLTGGTSAGGNGGDVLLGISGTLDIDSGGQISVSSSNEGLGGRIEIGQTLTNTGTAMAPVYVVSGATTSLDIDGTGSNQTGLLAQENGEGASDALTSMTPESAIKLTTGALTIENGGQINSGATDNGSAGDITITSTSLSIDGSSSVGNAGIFSETTGQALAVSTDSQLMQATEEGAATASGGSIGLTVGGNIALTSGGTISALSNTTGYAGQIAIKQSGGMVSDPAIVGTALNGGIYLDGGSIVTSAGGPGNSMLNASAGNITINAQALTMLDASKLNSSTDGFSKAGEIMVSGPVGAVSPNTQFVIVAGGSTIDSGTTGSVKATMSGAGGTITIKTGAVTVDGSQAGIASAISTIAGGGTGNGGQIYLTVTGAMGVNGSTGDVAVTNGGQISASSMSGSTALAGEVAINQSNSTDIATNLDAGIWVDGTGSGISTAAGAVVPSGTALATTPAGTFPGELTLNTQALTVSNTAQVSSGTTGSYDAGDVYVNSTMSPDYPVTVAAQNVVVATGGEISSQSSGNGAVDAGTVTINSGTITVTGTGSTISTNADAVGFETSDTTQIAAITLNTSELMVANNATITAETSGLLQGGTITISMLSTTGDVTLINNGTINASSFAPLKAATDDEAFVAANPTLPDPGYGNGGSIFIGAASIANLGLVAVPNGSSPATLNILTNSHIFADSVNTTGGEISIFADTVNIQHESGIETRGDGTDDNNGGTIMINAGSLFYLNDYSIISTHSTGHGGNIYIDPQFEVLNHSLIDAFGGGGYGNVVLLSDFTLSGDSQIAASGTVTIASFPLDLSGSLVGLPADLTDEAKRLRESCARAVNHEFSSLIVVGRSGTETAPDELNSDSGSSDGGAEHTSAVQSHEKLR